MVSADGPDPGGEAAGDGAGRHHLGRRQRWTALALVVMAWLAFAFPAFTGKVRFPVDLAGPPPGQPAARVLNPELGDAFYVLYPWHAYLGERLRAGDVPLWDPYRFAGTPFAADIATGVWYPPNWLYASGHVLFAFTAIALASMLGALLLSYWFFLRVDLHPYAAAFGAIVFVCSAFMIKWSTNEAVFASAMWLPLVLGGLEVARRGRVRRGVLLAAAGLGLSVLGGHAQVALSVWLVAAIWSAVDLVAAVGARDLGAADANRARAALRAAGPAVAAFALAAGLTAVQLLPTAQFAGQIVRQKTSLSAAQRTALPVQHLPTVLLPDYQGSPIDGNYGGPGVNYTETALYAGLLTLPLALIGLLRRPGRLAASFGVVAAVGVLAVMGTPLYRVILALPGFSRTLFMTRFILLVDFGLAGLAALGLHWLLVSPGRRAVPILAASGTALVAMVGVLTLARPGTTAAAGYLARRGLPSLVLLAVGTVALCGLVRRPHRASGLAIAAIAVGLSDLWLFGFRFNPFHSPRPVYARSAAVDFLADVPGQRPRFANIGTWSVPPNGELSYRLPGISGYDPFVPRRIVELLGLAEDQVPKATTNFLGPFRAETAASPVLDLLGVATVVTSPDRNLTGQPSYDGELRAYDRPGAFPPAWIAPCWEVLADTAVLPRLGGMTSPELAGTAVVADSPAARTALGARSRPASCGAGGRAVLERHSPERVVVRADADAAGVLVLSDAWYPGWRVRLDGRPAPLLRVDHALRGVALGPGRHTVEFDFRPASTRVGGATTVATGLLVAGWSAWSRRRGRRSAGDGQELDAGDAEVRQRPGGELGGYVHRF